MHSETQKKIDTSKLRKYIIDLPLTANKANWHHLNRLDQASGTPAAAVDGTGLVSFVAGVPPVPQQEDVLNSTLFAQQAANANAQLAGDTDPLDWYNFYASVLNTIGWVNQGFEFSQFSSSTENFTVSAVILDILEAIIDPEEDAVVAETLAALAESSNEEALSLWSTETVSGTTGKFQILPVSFTNDALVMKLGAFYFTGTETVTSLLGFEFSSANTAFSGSAEVVTLDEEIYASVRDEIVTRLSSTATTEVDNIPLASTPPESFPNRPA